MEENAQIYTLFGHGAIYSHNTLQNFVDYYVLTNPEHFQKNLEFIDKVGYGQLHGYDVQHLHDLEITRKYLLGVIRKFLQIHENSKHPPPSIESKENTLAVTTADKFIFRAFEKITSKNPENAKKYIELCQKRFCWDSKTDNPGIVAKYISRLEKIFASDNTDLVTKQKTAQLWVDLFKNRQIIDDIFSFLRVWISSPEVHVEVDKIFESLLQLEKEQSIAPAILDTNVAQQFFSNMFMVQSSASSRNTEMSFAAANGFFYVAHTAFGIGKFGTGKCGTIYTSLEALNDSPIFKSNKIRSMAVFNDHLEVLVDFKDIENKHVLYNLDLFSLQENKEKRKVFQELKEGYKFTSYENVKYENYSNIIIRGNTSEPLVLSTEENLNNATFITNGQTAVFCHHIEQSNSYEILEYSLSDGSLIQKISNETLVSPAIAIDSQAKISFIVTDKEIPLMIPIESNYFVPHSFKSYKNNKSNRSLLDIFQMLPNHAYSTCQGKEIFRIIDITKCYDALATILKTPNKSAEQFIVPLLQLIIAHLTKYHSKKPPLFIVEALSNKWIKDRIEVEELFIYVLFSDLDSDEDEEIIKKELGLFDHVRIINGIAKIENIGIKLAKCLLENHEILKEAITLKAHQYYTFIQSIVKTVTEDHFINNRPATIILPIILELDPNELDRHPTHLFYSFFASLLPLLQSAIKHPAFFCASMSKLSALIKVMHEHCPENELKRFAEHHARVSTDNPITIKEEIDETKHPYDNNQDYTNHHELTNAIEVTIRFDPNTNTEPNCDWLQIYKDREMKQKLTERMSGRYSKWQKEIKGNMKHLVFHFHSDTSVVEWGYKATITSRIFKQNNYESPKPEFDIFRELYVMVFRELNRIIPYAKRAPDFQQTIEILSRKLNKNLSSDIDYWIPELAYQSINEEISDLIISMTSSLESFSNLAIQMLFCAPQGAEYDPSINAAELQAMIKDHRNDQRVLAEMEKLNATDAQGCSSLVKCKQWANIVALAYSLIQKPNLDQFKHSWRRCIEDVALQTPPVGQTTTPVYLEEIGQLGKCIDSPKDGIIPEGYIQEFAPFYARQLTSLLAKEQDDSIDRPVVSLVLKSILRFKREHVSECERAQIFEAVRAALMLNIPYVIPDIMRIIQTFDLREANIENLKELITKIGFHFTKPKVDSEKVTFNTYKSFACSIAECVRMLVTTESMNGLADLIQNGSEEEMVGSLLILSAAHFPIRPNSVVHYMSGSRELKARILSIDPINIEMAIEEEGMQEIHTTIQRVNFDSLTPLPTNILPIVPEPLFGASGGLIDAISEKVKSPLYGSIANAALTELIPGAVDVNFADVYFKLQEGYIPTEVLSDQNETVEFEEMTKQLEVMPQIGLLETLRSKPRAYILKADVTSFSFRPEGNPVLFGFCEKENPLPSAAFLISACDKTIKYRQSVLVDHEDLGEIHATYLRDGMRVFVAASGHVYSTDLYLPPMRNPIPVIIANTKINIESNPTIIQPLSHAHLLIANQLPTHIQFDDRFICTDSIFEPIVLNRSERTKVSLVPAISFDYPELFYAEFSFGGTSTTVSLQSPFISGLRLYSMTIKEKYDTAGILIDMVNKRALMTVDGEYLEESAMTISFPDKCDVSIQFNVDNIEQVYVNTGSMPFLADYEELFEKAVLKKEEVESSPPFPVCPMQECPSSQERQSSQKLSKNNFKTSLLSPYIVVDPESPYLNRVGLGSTDPQTGSVNLRFESDDKIITVRFEAQCVSGLIENESKDIMEFQSKVYRFMRAIDATEMHCSCLNMKNAERFKWEALHVCVEKILEIGTVADEVRVETLIQAVTKGSVPVFGKYAAMKQTNNLLHSIFERNDPILRTLCETAVNSLMIQREHFEKYPLYTICNNEKETSRITLNNADALLFVAERVQLQGSLTIRDQFDHSITVKKGSKQIFVFRGDTIMFSSLPNSDSLAAHIIPISFSNPPENLNIRFALGFIYSLVDYISSNPEKPVRSLLDECILRPLWYHIMNNRFRILTSSMADWFSILLKTEIFTDTLEKYKDDLSISAIAEEPPSFFTGVICLLSMYIYRRDRFPFVLESALNLPRCTFGAEVFRQFALQLVSPISPPKAFKTRYTPSVVMEALKLSQYSNPKVVIVDKATTVSTEVSFNECEKIAFLRVFPRVSASITVNQIPTNTDQPIAASSASIKITRGAPNDIPFVLFVIPIFKEKKLTQERMRGVEIMKAELAKTWTIQHEALARHVAQSAFTRDAPYIITAYSSELLKRMFPGVSPRNARFRIALIYISLRRTADEADQISMNSMPDTIGSLSQCIVPPDQLFVQPKEGGHPLPYGLQTKSGHTSDFFGALYENLMNNPNGRLLNYGDTIELANATETKDLSTVVADLTDDLFKDGEPIEGAVSEGHLRGYLGFGLYCALCIAAGRRLPLRVSARIIQTVLGSGRTDTPQLSALHIGARPVVAQCKRLDAFANDPVFASYYLLASSMQDVPETDNAYGLNFVTSPLFSDFVARVVNGQPISGFISTDEDDKEEPLVWRVETKHYLSIPRFEAVRHLLG